MDCDAIEGGGGGGQSCSIGSSRTSWGDCCKDDVVVRIVCARLPLLCSINGFEVKDKPSCSCVVAMNVLCVVYADMGLDVKEKCYCVYVMWMERK